MSPQSPTRARLQRARVWRDLTTTWVRRHPLLVDAALVALLLVLSHPRPDGPHTIHPAGWAWALVAALLVPLIWRRRAPFAVFLLVAAVALVQWFTRQLLAADLAPLVAFYTVAAYEAPRRILIAAGVLEIGAAMAAIRFTPANATSWAFLFISCMVAAAGIIGYNIRTRRAYLAALEDRAARLERDRARDADMAAATERARIAREMHDIVAHNIAVMIALADGAAYTTRIDPDQAVTIMGQVADSGRAAMTEMRRLLGVMRQPMTAAEHTPQPTLADLDDLLTTVRAAGLPVRMSVSGAPLWLPPSAQLTIYRMTQEALTNALKHAGAAATEVRIRYRPDAVELDVVNDGPAQRGIGKSTAGHGIAGMRERAAVYGGEVHAGPRPAGGWRVHAVLPITSEGGTGQLHEVIPLVPVAKAVPA